VCRLSAVRPFPVRASNLAPSAPSRSSFSSARWQLLPPSAVARTLPLALDLPKTLEFFVPTPRRTRHHRLLVGPRKPSGACSPWILRPTPLRLRPCPAPTDVALVYDDLIFRYFFSSLHQRPESDPRLPAAPTRILPGRSSATSVGSMAATSTSSGAHESKSAAPCGLRHVPGSPSCPTLLTSRARRGCLGLEGAGGANAVRPKS
jgi:hypothetical protein